VSGTYTLVVNGTNVYTAQALGDGGSLTGQDVAAQVNLFSTTTGVSASYAGGSLTFTSVDGRNTNIVETISLGTAGTGGATAGVAGSGTGVAVAQEGVVRGTVTLSASDNITMTGQYADIGQAAAISKDTTTISAVNVLTVAAANTAINRIDSALTSVSSLRSTFGAVQNRFESTISNLTAVSENLSAARSRIKDADFAQETANLTRAQILQQAGTAMLAQANSLPQGVLALLK